MNEKLFIINYPYFTKSGLIFWGIGYNNPGREYGFTRLPDGDLVLEATYGAKIYFILPVEARFITITLSRAIRPDMPLIEFGTTDNILERAEFPTKLGDNEFVLPRFVRYIYMYHSPYNVDSMYIKKISWRSE